MGNTRENSLVVKRQKHPAKPVAKTGKFKAQSAIELMIVLAVGMVVLGIVIYSSQNNLAASSQSLAFSIAKSSSAQITAAADLVYFEGVGARRLVQFIIPEGAIAVIVSANSVNIRMQNSQGVSDAQANTRSPICPNSNLPSTPGTYTIVVESQDGCVLVGNSGSLQASTTLLTINAHSNSTVFRQINYTNIGTSAILVNLNLTFESNDAIVSLVNPSDAIFSLSPGQIKTIDINFTLESIALGSYFGSIMANTTTENVQTALVIDASAQFCGNQVQCSPTASDIAAIEIATFSTNSYIQKKEIFDPSEPILIRGDGWDIQTALILDLRDPSDSFSIGGYPKIIETNSTGGFYDSTLASGFDGLIGYIVRATGSSGGIPFSTQTNFDIISCT